MQLMPGTINWENKKTQIKQARTWLCKLEALAENLILLFCNNKFLFIPIDRCIIQTSLEGMFWTADVYYRDAQLVNVWRIRDYEVLRSEWDISVISPSIKALGWLWKKGPKDDKNQKQWTTSAKHIYWTQQCHYIYKLIMVMTRCLYETYTGQAN